MIWDYPRKRSWISPLTLVGRQELTLENHLGIKQYSPRMVKVRVKGGFLEIRGEDLMLKNLTRESLTLAGRIDCLGFETE
ncbi:MAG TPA: hypothetical protein ENM97_05880 [Moorella mulderi]|nr:hypothetical protein [Moorella mulderi]